MSTTETAIASDSAGVFYNAIPLDTIKPSPTNPRKRFDEAELNELAVSIKEKGLIQPIVIRPAAGKKKANELWEIIAGERRWRASKIAGLESISAIARNLDDKAVLELQVIENLQRVDVHPLDESNGFKKLMDAHGYTVEILSEKVGKSVAYIYARLKLNDLLPELQVKFYADELTAGHAILLARLAESSQIDTAKEGLFDLDWNPSTGKKERRLVSVRELAQWIDQHIQMELAKSPFDPKDAELVPAAGACLTCPKRSGSNPVLFPELGKKDVCTDRDCYNRKVGAFIKKGTESGELIAITTEHNESKRPKGSLYEYDHGQWRQIGEDGGKCEHAKKAIFIDGYSKGKVIQICRTRECRKHFSPSPRTTKAPKELAADRARREKAEAERSFRREVHAKVAGKLKDASPDKLFLTFSKRDVLAVIAYRVFQSVDSKVRTDVCNDLGIKDHYSERDYQREKISALSVDALIRLTVRMISANCLGSVSEWSTNVKDGSEDLLALAESFGIDHAKIRSGLKTAAAAKAKEKPTKKAAKKKAKKA